MMNMTSKHDHVPHHVRPVRPDWKCRRCVVMIVMTTAPDDDENENDDEHDDENDDVDDGVVVFRPNGYKFKQRV